MPNDTITWPGHSPSWNIAEVFPHRAHHEGSLQFGVELEIGTGTHD